ncbi:hypothetical protein BGZ65_012117, partial [Modicella reniformis]
KTLGDNEVAAQETARCKIWGGSGRIMNSFQVQFARDVSRRQQSAIWQEPVETDFRVQRLKFKHGVQSVQFSQYDKESAERISFSGSGVEYSVAMDFEEDVIRSCTYPYYTQYAHPASTCMYLVSRIYEDFVVSRGANPARTGPEQTQGRICALEAFGFPVETIISPA